MRQVDRRPGLPPSEGIRPRARHRALRSGRRADRTREGAAPSAPASFWSAGSRRRRTGGRAVLADCACDLRRPRTSPSRPRSPDACGSRSGGASTVEIAHGLPIGQGFGMSAAGALATALAVVARPRGHPPARHRGRPPRRPLRRRRSRGCRGDPRGRPRDPGAPGVPRSARSDTRRSIPSIFLSVVGPPVPSPPLLRDPTFLARVARAAEEGLEFPEREPSVERVPRSLRAVHRPPGPRPARPSRPSGRCATASVASLRRCSVAACSRSPDLAREGPYRRAPSNGPGVPPVELNAATRGAGPLVPTVARPGPPRRPIELAQALLTGHSARPPPP